MMNDVFKCFKIINKHSDEFLDSKLKKYSLCSCHRIFIKKIFENPGITRDNLKNIVHVHPSNTTRAIDYLEEKGYITKQINKDDKRICLLYPTDKLKEVYSYLIKIEEEWIRIITDGLEEDEINNYLKYLSLSTELSIKHIHKK